ncbi:MAG: hypothetical protein J0J15_25135, partial [Mesorhizobium sp.]|nr:hypothetical protein [Mesorhizobium sp.]
LFPFVSPSPFRDELDGKKAWQHYGRISPGKTNPSRGSLHVAATLSSAQAPRAIRLAIRLFCNRLMLSGIAGLAGAVAQACLPRHITAAPLAANHPLG